MNGATDPPRVTDRPWATAPAPPLPAISAAQAESAAKLVRLGVQVHEMQALLTRLLQDVVQADTRLEHADPARLVQANEQLLLAALNSRDQADAATQALRQAERSTLVDPLTHLPNRTALLERFVQAAATARRHSTSLALLFVDLDDFKQVNDSRNHAFGDQVLCLVAERMLDVVREVDTVSRHGGDEFLILLADIGNAAAAANVAEKIVAAIREPVLLEGQQLQISASIGIAMCPQDGEDLQTLVACADAAMYGKKKSRDLSPAVPEKARQPTPGSQADHWHAHLRQANERLLLATLTAQELQAAAERAQQRQRALLTAVATELLVPTAPIRMAAGMLGRDSGDAVLLPRVQALVETRLQQIARLVAKVVEQARLEDGALIPGPAWVDLAPLIQAEATACAEVLAQRQQTLSLQLGVEPLGVHGDARRLRQALANLLDNASGHTPTGGHISVDVTSTPATLSLTVADNGLGLTAQQLPHVFEPFQQQTPALGLHGDVALGIGLTVVRAVVHAHGGELVAQSDGVHRGSRFIVTLPRVDAPA